MNILIKKWWKFLVWNKEENWSIFEDNSFLLLCGCVMLSDLNKFVNLKPSLPRQCMKFFLSFFFERYIENVKILQENLDWWDGKNVKFLSQHFASYTYEKIVNIMNLLHSDYSNVKTSFYVMKWLRIFGLLSRIQVTSSKFTVLIFLAIHNDLNPNYKLLNSGSTKWVFKTHSGFLWLVSKHLFELIWWY